MQTILCNLSITRLDLNYYFNLSVCSSQKKNMSEKKLARVPNISVLNRGNPVNIQWKKPCQIEDRVD